MILVAFGLGPRTKRLLHYRYRQILLKVEESEGLIYCNKKLEFRVLIISNKG